MVQLKTDAKTTTSSFHWFLAATFMSAVGRNGYNVACSWLLVVSVGGVSSVATFFMASSVTEMLASPVCGWMCDRFDRRRLAVIADAVRGASAAVLCLLSGMEDFYWFIWLSTIVFATSDRLALTAMQSMVPQVAGRHSLPVANSYTFFFMQVGSLVAAASVGIILFTSTSVVSVLVIALCFTGSVTCMLFVAYEAEGRSAGNNQACGSLRFDAALVRLGLIYCLLYIGGLLISAVGPSLVFEELQGNALDFGHLESVWSAGSILGAVLLVPIARATQSGTLQIVVLGITAVSFALIKLSDFPMLLLVICVLGTSYNLGRVAIEVALQSTVPCYALGRAKGLLHCAAMTVGVVVLAMIAIFPGATAPTTIFLIYSVLIILCIFGLMLRLPRIR